MLSPRFLRMYGERCRRSAQATNDPRSVAEFEAMARDLEDWATDPAGRKTLSSDGEEVPLTAPRRDEPG